MATSDAWLVPWSRAIEAEFQGRPIVAALATVDEEGSPHVRFVVVRRVDDDGTFWITTDARSAKAGQVRASRGRVELAFWLATVRTQFRVAGTASRFGPGGEPGVRDAIWAGLSDASRALFTWPAPGSPRDEAEPSGSYQSALPVTEGPPHSFEAWSIVPDRVDGLELAEHPHRRAFWTRGPQGEWNEALVHP